MSLPQIRIRQTDDLELVADLDRQAFDDCWLTEEELHAATWWIAEVRQDGAWQPVAYTGLEVKGNGYWVFLARSGVIPEARGSRLQRRLIAVRERWARAHGCTLAYTYVHWCNTRSMRSLVHCGYVPYRWEVDTNGKVPTRFIYLSKTLSSGKKQDVERSCEGGSPAAGPHGEAYT